ncbi:hypothetical protein GDO86_005927 [Hymenochirus boettgeri]|uniref:Uncharacterized protein n=1 Tax=Hymenochirus boettgeri TaxID=247094 RepID=A0A8T2J911_9PIPI|nr:hypothetical protein GDO86_005927 [Hymenochirus boettgeri]
MSVDTQITQEVVLDKPVLAKMHIINTYRKTYIQKEINFDKSNVYNLCSIIYTAPVRGEFLVGQQTQLECLLNTGVKTHRSYLNKNQKK